MNTERRRHFDPTPRITYAATNVIGNTKLVMRNGYAHIALSALGWVPLVVEDDFALMQAPEGIEA